MSSNTLSFKVLIVCWAATVLFPFSSERLLRDTAKPPAELIVLKEVKVRSCPQDEVLQTPVTPVTTEALATLHNPIK